MSEREHFRRSALAALALWQKWSELEGSDQRPTKAPTLLELQTLCRQTSCALPELESYARVQGRRPALLLLGGEAELAVALAGLLGYEAAIPDLPLPSLIWSVDSARDNQFRIRQAGNERVVQREAVIETLRVGSSEDWTLVEALSPAPATWRLLWVPNPAFFRTDDCRPMDLELLLAQRAAVVIADDTPVPLQRMLEAMGQRMWLVQKSELETTEDRERLFETLAGIMEERSEESQLSRSTTWTWLRERLLEQIDARKREYNQLINGHEMKVSSSRHLLGQYRKNMTNGVRTLVEAYFQARVSSTAFAAFYDVQKPGPKSDSFLAASGLQSLWGKLDEYVTDRMADFITGLTGLAAKLELHHVRLGDVNARWVSKTLAPGLEGMLSAKKVFPAKNAKGAGLMGSLGGRKQVVLDERKAQVLKASRIVVQHIESEFSDWCGTLMASVESGVSTQLSASLVRRGMADLQAVRSALEGLDRLEALLRTELPEPAAEEVTPGPIEWVRALASNHIIPLYQPS